jgi:hypothetical protein
MTRKSWIVLGIVVMVSSLLMVTVVVASAAQAPEAGAAALGADERLAAQGAGGSLAVAAANPVTTSFTYQGQLKDSGGPVNGDCQMVFRLYDDAASGDQVGPAVTETVSIADGLFTVGLEFGEVFTGTARWLSIQVQCPGDTGYTTLSPRQALSPVPYALALPGLWTQQNGICPNLLGGYWGNWVADGVVGATIGGGGESGFPNRVSADYGTVAGGVNNLADGSLATVGGGDGNQAGGDYAVVAGGIVNRASGDYAAVGGGWDNTASGDQATVGGGEFNAASGRHATIGGGQDNIITDTADYATVGGGYSNIANNDYATIGGGTENSATMWYATVGGGYSNDATGNNATVAGGNGNIANGDYSSVAGGSANVADGDYSFAAGRRAIANHTGAFVWADSRDHSFSSTASNEFSVRATGGARFVLNIDSTFGIPTWTCSVSSGGTWSCSSDRNLKENLILADGSDVLERLSHMPVYYWNAKGQTTPHIGPMAQDFYAAYGVGDSDVAISTIDLDGVALAAIQGLHAQNQGQATRIEQLEAENADLEARVAALEAASASGSAPSQGPQANLKLWVGALLAGAGLVWAFRRRDGLTLFNGGGR